MNKFMNIIQNLIEIICSKQFLLCIETISFIVMITISTLLTKIYLKQNTFKQKSAAFYFLLFTIISLAIENLSWIFKLLYFLEVSPIQNYKNIQIFITAAWIFNTILYHSFGLFIEHIIENKLNFRLHHKIFFICHAIFIPLFIYSAYYHIIGQHWLITANTIFRIAVLYRPILIMPSIIIALYKIYYNDIPSILKKQLTIFLQIIIAPLILSDLIQCLPIFYQTGATSDIAGIMGTICTIYMTAAVIFCARNLMRFRFFNFSTRVQDKHVSDLGGNFKDTIEKISLARTPHELKYITQTFFKDTFNIPNENVHLYFRYKQEYQIQNSENSFCTTINNVIESFISKNDNQLIELLQEYRILVSDEVAFDAYYNGQEPEKLLTNFLQSIDSEIFLPMYDNKAIIAYLAIKRRKNHRFYNVTEQNKMVIFGTFLASAINIIHNNNAISLLHENKKIKEELYLKHQEVHQYKESIKTLLKQKSSSHVGILLYRDDRFTFSNETARHLLPINLNHPRRHPAAIAMTKLAQQVESFRTLQTKILYDNYNKQMLVTGVPHLDYQGGVILTLHYPDSSDIIKTHIDKLQDPSQLDYLLYLETTKSGKLINQLLPSYHETFLNFKIKLLQIALNKKATLLQTHNEDLQTIVEIIHNISLRTTLHILDLKPTLVTHDLGIKLFGLNPLLMLEQERGLLEKLDQKGTLFIKNIEFLDLNTQNKLAEFIRYGMFTLLKSEQKVFSDVRIICSLSENPEKLIAEKKLSPELFNELAETSLQMPSLKTIETHELEELIDQIAYQMTESNNFSSLLSISKKEKTELLDHKPASLQEFKLKIQHLLAKKSKEYDVAQEYHYDPELHITDPKLLRAAALGKQALKDPDMMSMLWSQFNCQNKIALLLGVNRSSVQRRCKEYNLL